MATNRLGTNNPLIKVHKTDFYVPMIVYYFIYWWYNSRCSTFIIACDIPL